MNRIALLIDGWMDGGNDMMDGWMDVTIDTLICKCIKSTLSSVPFDLADS